jgi:NDP-sugar pyrophosphorylase family protein
MNGDLLTDISYPDLWQFHHDRQAVATVAMYRRQEHIELGVLEVDNEGLVTGYIEKPTYHFLVSMGIYILEPCVLKFILPGVAMDLPDLVRTLISVGERVVAYPFSGLWLDIGRPDDYVEAQRRLKETPGQFLGPNVCPISGRY